MSRPVALNDVTVAIDPLAVAAEAARELFNSLGATMTTGTCADIAITRDAQVEYSAPVRVVLTACGHWPDHSHASSTSPTPIPAHEEGPGVGSLRIDPSLGFGPVAETVTAAHAVLIALAGLLAVRNAGSPTTGRVAMDEVMATCVADLLIPVLCHRLPRPRRSTAERTPAASAQAL